MLKPRLSRITWERSQPFDITADDPDPTAKKCDLELPSFVTAVGPVARAQQTTVEETNVPHAQGSVAGFNFARAASRF